MRNLPSIWREFERPISSFGAWRPLLEQIDSFMNDAWSQRGSESFSPAFDMRETSDQYLLFFDMPGVDRKDIDIEVQGNTLSVRGERKQEQESGSGHSRIIERRYGQFERSISLPDGVNSSQVEASYDNGVLMIAVPKAVEAKSTKVQIGEGKASSQKTLQSGNGGKKEAAPSKGGETAEKSTDSSKRGETMQSGASRT